MPRPEPGLMSASNVENIVSNEVRRTQWVARQDTLITNHHHQIFGGFSTATVRRSHYPPPLIPSEKSVDWARAKSGNNDLLGCERLISPALPNPLSPSTTICRILVSISTSAVINYFHLEISLRSTCPRAFN